MATIRQMLAGGDLRSIGSSNLAVAKILAQPGLFHDLFCLLLDNDPILRMRAADAMEKLSKIHPDWLQPYKGTLLTQVALIDQIEVKWHVAQMFSYLTLNQEEKNLAVEILQRWIASEKSKIVVTFSLQSLADMASTDAVLRKKILPLIIKAAASSSKAVQSRSRKLLIKLNKVPG